MTVDPHILLLGGSAEARLLAEALSARGIRYAFWLSEAPRGPAPLPQVPQLRRFESAAAMGAQIARCGFTAVVDASHTFDGAVSDQAQDAAAGCGVSYLRVARPVWDVSAHPAWRRAGTALAANEMIPAGARVFCATGWDSLAAFADFRGEVLMLRQTRRHGRAAPYPFVELVFGDPPFDAAAEKALFTALRIDLLVCRNLGGEASRTKLDAAADLDIPVILIDRPAASEGIRTVETVEDALRWVDAL